MAPESDSFTWYQAQQVLTILGTGETLPAQKPRMMISENEKKINSTSMNHQPPKAPSPSPPPNSTPKTQDTLKPSKPTPTEEKPKPLLPTFSSSTDSSSIDSRKNKLQTMQTFSGSMDAGERSSLELAMKLQAEEQRRSQSIRSAPPPPVTNKNPNEWTCADCTFDNKMSATKCEMCGGGNRKPKNDSSSSSRPPPP